MLDAPEPTSRGPSPPPPVDSDDTRDQVTSLASGEAGAGSEPPPASPPATPTVDEQHKRRSMRNSLSSSITSVGAKSTVAFAVAQHTIKETVFHSVLHALRGGMWAIVMGLPSLIILLARGPGLRSWGFSLIMHDPELAYPPVYAAADPADPKFPPTSHVRLNWAAHMDECLENTLQFFSTFVLVVLHLSYTHPDAFTEPMRKLRWLVFFVCTPAISLQVFGRTLMFTSTVAQLALIYIPWITAVTICSKKAKKPLTCPNFAVACGLAGFAYLFIGGFYVYILVPIVMRGAPGRQAIILVIVLPLVRTVGTTLARLASFISTGLSIEHRCVLAYFMPCTRARALARLTRARTLLSPSVRVPFVPDVSRASPRRAGLFAGIAGYTGRLLISSVPNASARAITIVLTSIVNVGMRVQESFRCAICFPAPVLARALRLGTALTFFCRVPLRLGNPRNAQGEECAQVQEAVP
jgi:hypothetical protein